MFFKNTGLTPEEIKMLNGKGADAPANDGWIPVEERLPEDDHYILLPFANFNLPMRGEVKDQFGLEAPLAERTKAAVELAKRKVDVAQKTDTGGIVIVNNIPRTGKE